MVVFVANAAIAAPATAASAKVGGEADRSGEGDEGDEGDVDILLTMELMATQSITGALLGLYTAELNRELRIEEATVAIGALAGGAFGLTLGLQRIPTRTALALETGAAWGHVHSLMLMESGSALGLDRPTRSLFALLCPIGGMALGVTVAEITGASAHQIALGNSFGLWSGVWTLMLFDALDLPTGREEAIGILLGADLAFVVGTIVGRELGHLTRGRVLLLDAAALFGTTVSFAIADESLPGDDALVWGVVGAVTFVAAVSAWVGSMPAPVHDDPPPMRLLPYFDRDGRRGASVAMTW